MFSACSVNMFSAFAHGLIGASISDTASTEQANLLLIESCLLRGLTHKNLLPILSVCLEDSDHPLIMYQFMNKGNLKLFLRKSRSCEGTTQVNYNGLCVLKAQRVAIMFWFQFACGETRF